MESTRTLIITFLIGLTILSCSEGEVVANHKENKQPYNVLFIAIDDLNDWTGFAGGHPQAQTPNMDKLAKQGVVFENAYCAASVCNPSRAALMSGYRPSTTGVYGNGTQMRDSEVLKDALTIPQWFSKYGYFTTARGKIFHSANGEKADTISWDKWIRTTGGYGAVKRESGYLANGIPVGEADENFDWGPTDATFEDTQDYITAKWAADQLEKDYDKPFFLACGIFRPHLKWHVPQEFFDKFPEGKMILPEVNENDYDDIPKSALGPSKNYFAAKKYKKQQAAVQAYLACINYADACVGVVLDALAKSKYAENTIVVLWGDHGWHLGEKLRYKKFTLWEEACNMPLIFKVPGVTEAGSRCNNPVSLMDLYPTLSELCGLPINPENEGNSIVPLLSNVNTNWDKPALTTLGFNRHTVRNKKWRYTKYQDGAEELYNHENDPLEWKNLANDPQYNSVKHEMSKYLPTINHPEVQNSED
ncbi:sulfatase [Draconibacterium sp.]|uniref:sulfatase n=1 Tax=Draconibacterium sp. TaxID=1965318 RepID=UPI003568FA20